MNCKALFLFSRIECIFSNILAFFNLMFLLLRHLITSGVVLLCHLLVCCKCNRKLHGLNFIFRCKSEWFTEVCRIVDASLISSTTAGSLLDNSTAAGSALDNSTMRNTTVCERVSNKGSDSVTEYWK